MIYCNCDGNNIFCSHTSEIAITMRRAKKKIISKKKVEDVPTLVPEFEYDYMVDGDKPSPAKYNKKMARKIYMLSTIGLTQAQMAVQLDMSIKTLQSWLSKRPECKDAYQKEKLIHDTSVQETMLKRALGYSYEEVSVHEGVDSIGRPYSRTSKVIKHVLPDPTCMIFWLKNRHRGQWSDVQQHQIQSKVDVNITNALNLDKLSDTERGIIESLARKKLEQSSGDKRG